MEFGSAPSSESNEPGLLESIDIEPTENGGRSSCASTRCQEGDWSRNSNREAAALDIANGNAFAAGLELEPCAFTAFSELDCPGCLGMERTLANFMGCEPGF